MPMKNPSHPGRIIRGAIEELGLSTAQAAEALGVTRNTLHRIITSKSGVSADMAVRLEAVIGSTADHWLRLQAAFDLAQVRNDEEHPARNMKRIPVPSEPRPEQPRLV